MRRGLVAGTIGLFALAGGGRLVHDEVVLVDERAEQASLRQQLQFREDEALRTARIELDLAQARQRARDLRGRLDAARAEAERLDADLSGARADLAGLEEARAALAGERDALAARAAEATELASERAATIARVESLAEARRRSLEEVEALAAARAEALAEAERLKRELAEALAAARSRLEAQSERLDAVEAERSALGERLAAEQARAEGLDDELARTEDELRRQREVLAAVREAGVNVDRLAGLDPMPEIRAIVVTIDHQAMPPIVLVDAGARAGLHPRDELFVVREGREIARLVVEEVQDRVASTRLAWGARGSRLQRGDRVLSAPPAER